MQREAWKGRSKVLKNQGTHFKQYLFARGTRKSEGEKRMKVLQNRKKSLGRHYLIISRMSLASLLGNHYVIPQVVVILNSTWITCFKTQKGSVEVKQRSYCYHWMGGTCGWVYCRRYYGRFALLACDGTSIPKSVESPNKSDSSTWSRTYPDSNKAPDEGCNGCREHLPSTGQLVSKRQIFGITMRRAIK